MNLPSTTSLSFTGKVMSISRVPLRFSSAMSRIVTTGMTSIASPAGTNSNSGCIVARSSCQNPPRYMKKNSPKPKKLRQMTT